MKLLLILVLCVCSLAAAPGRGVASDASQELSLALQGADQPPLRYCGQTLARLLTLLCFNNSEDNYLAASANGRAALAAGRGARAARRVRRDVVEHCCYSVCTLPDLLTYC